MGILKDSSIVVAGVIISNILGYIFHIYAGRVLGPVDYGVFGALMALFSLIALPAGAISSAITKFAAKFNYKKEYSKIGVLRKEISRKVWAYSILMFIIITLLSKYIADYLKISSSIPIIIVGFTLIFAMVLPINRGVLQGMKKFKDYSWNTILESVSRLVLFVLLFFIGFRANSAILAYGLAYLVAFIAIFPFIKETKTKEDTNIDMKPVYKFVLTVLFINILLQLIINMPTLFVKHYLSSEFTGYWTAALTIARISLFVSGGIALVMFSEVAEKETHKDKKEVFKKAFFLTLSASSIIALIFITIPNVLITSLYGHDYNAAVKLLEVMGIAMIPLSILQLGINYWLAKK